MALRSHWLDDVFADPSKAKEAFSNHPKVKAAFEAAAEAYKAQAQAYKENPGYAGSTAPQAAPVSVEDEDDEFGALAWI